MSLYAVNMLINIIFAVYKYKIRLIEVFKNMFQSYQLFLFLLKIATFFLLILVFGCKNESASEYTIIKGKALGSDYYIEVKSTDTFSIKQTVDSIFQRIEMSMSLSLKESTLSRYNRADSLFCYSKNEDPYFEPIFLKAVEIYNLSQGAFNPAVHPLIEYYGFSGEEIKPLKKEDTVVINALNKLVLFDHIKLLHQDEGNICITKPTKGVMLNFNAVSFGYAIDMMAAYFENRKIKDYMINVGSLYRALGKDAQSKFWVIDIERPEPDNAAKKANLPLQISNKSMVTNGNYQKMYEVNGQKYSHIISPFTGISHPTDILSVTVISDECITADAFATAFMVLGLDKSLSLTEQLKGVEACFIYDSDDDGVYEFKASPGFSKYYLNNDQK